VKDYLLFVDTETTGFPSDWTKAYATKNAWPHVVQVAWVLFKKDGTVIKSENHFLKAPKGSLKPASVAIHGITEAFLEKEGEDAWGPLKQLATDLKIYQPLVIGHYIRLDFHMLGVEFARAGINNPVAKLPTFCTMQALKPHLTNGEYRFQRLHEVYNRLFHTPLVGYHNAQVDVQATARVFFELVKMGEITEASIELYPQLVVPKSPGFFGSIRSRFSILGALSVFFSA